ncbi:MAG: TlpA family protein disulfide reductase, partial [Mycobacterium sp.]
MRHNRPSKGVMGAAWLATLGAVLAALVVAVVVNAASSSSSSRPSFSLHRLEGNGPAVQLSQFKGHPVVVTFFASWCVPCHEELPTIASVQRGIGPAQPLPGRAVDFVGVDVGDDAASALSLVNASQVAFPVGVDPNSQVSGEVFHLVGVPSTVFLDAGGNVVGSVRGPVT